MLDKEKYWKNVFTNSFVFDRHKVFSLAFYERPVKFEFFVWIRLSGLREGERRGRKKHKPCHLNSVNFV